MTAEIKKPATGHDITKKSSNEKAIIEALAKEMRLRQWCVEQMVKLAAVHASINAQEFTNFIYNFITDKENPDAKSPAI